MCNSTDCWSLECHRCGFSGCQIQWKVVSITFMHHFHTKVGTVENVSPCRNDMILRVNQRLVEVETIQVEGHGANTKSGKPDANDRPGSQKEVK